MVFSSTLNDIIIKLLGYKNLSYKNPLPLWVAIISSILTLFLFIIPTQFVLKYIPWIIGKKKK